MSIAVETMDKATGRVRLSVVNDVTSITLTSFVKENVYKGATVITDDWGSYNNLHKCGYRHQIQTATKKSDDVEVLPNVHRVASLLKRWLLGTHQNYASNEKLQYYLVSVHTVLTFEIFSLSNFHGLNFFDTRTLFS